MPSQDKDRHDHHAHAHEHTARPEEPGRLAHAHQDKYAHAEEPDDQQVEDGAEPVVVEQVAERGGAGRA